MQITVRNGTTTINGKTYQGRNIQITNKRILIDGVEQDGNIEPPIDVQVNGHVEHLDLEEGTIRTESAGTIKTVSGDVECGDVAGPVSTVSGDVEAGTVAGPVSTVSGDVCHQ